MALTLENQNLYNTLFPNSQSSNQGGLFQTYNSGGFSNMLSGNLGGNNESNVSNIESSGGSGLNIGNAVNMGISTAQQLIPGASSNPYLNAAKNNPLMKAGLKTMNPVVIGAGLLSTAILGGRAKKQQEQLKKQTDINSQNQQVLAEGLQSKRNEVSDFYSGQRKAAGNAYGISDIDNFLKQNRV